MYSDVSEDESGTLNALISFNFYKARFQSAVRSLLARFEIYASTSPAPLPAPGLIVTPEIRAQSEQYLPIADITAIFNRLYAAALAYPPILSSTPFHNSLSWADTFAALPTQFQFSANPARLLETLLADDALLTRFLLTSFLPRRFYGGIRRYPGQQRFVGEWLETIKPRTLRCLDAACGTGEDTYGLALLLSEHGFLPDNTWIDGWTLEPLEVWAATHRSFPHDRRRETLFREATSTLLEKGFQTCIRFRCVDLTVVSPHAPLQAETNGSSDQYDLILCNGLLGGPIIHGTESVERVVTNLVQLLAPGGILLAADNFHGGWKQKCPQTELRASFELHGLKYVEIGEGIGGLKPD